MQKKYPSLVQDYYQTKVDTMLYWNIMGGEGQTLGQTFKWNTSQQLREGVPKLGKWGKSMCQFHLDNVWEADLVDGGILEDYTANGWRGGGRGKTLKII